MRSICLGGLGRVRFAYVTVAKFWFASEKVLLGFVRFAGLRIIIKSA